MSNGVASNRSPTASTSDGATKRNTAVGSMKRRMSQGQAMRSILGRARHPDGAATTIAFGNHLGGNRRLLCLGPAKMATLERLGGDAVLTEPGGGPLAEFLTFSADHNDGLAG
jgi:hypothetical protein